MTTPTVLVVEDDPIMGESLQLRLRLENYNVDLVSDLCAARKALQTRLYPLVLSDIRLPDGDGGSLLATMLERYGGCCPPLVFMTGYGSVEQAVRLVRQGAWDYIQKPFDLDALIQRIGEWMPPGTHDDDAWFGISPASQALEQLIDRIASLDLPVLIQGESGTGKELVAQHIRARIAAQPGARHDLPMVAINCAAIHEGLLESELFGHEAGAFTGANKRHHGVFERANGGVLFLDEIGDMSMPVQAKLLRVLQDGQVCRLGSEKDLHVSVRLICATHKRLDKMAETGAFRRDLLFRISGVPIHLPPLRERADDIAWLAHRRVQTLNAKTGQSKRLDPRFVSWAKLQPWEGNVRELFSALDRAYHFASDCWVRWERFGMPCSNPGSSTFADRAHNVATPLGDYLARAEREYLTQVMNEREGKMAETAEVLGISRKTLWEKLRRHKIAT
ncbi:MAG: sigma-54-dependent transcriptional regulator [Thiomonas sp.]|uniref:Sigma-54-dependent Fis family transcriptional regulator n=2 Tax=Thiomonas TaxID=32012 RepID=A0A8I1SW01_THIA3|nr:sigma-54 dependent transcriptional regulator [Thiomonas arsenitoxydans]MBN8744877.1 sigma-54-dependent Fis family transcriptional regulator [Thiomonas arsenitoxydans]